MLAKSKLNSIETLISWALIDLEIIHELFKTIVNEKKSMKKWKTVYFLTSVKWLKISVETYAKNCVHTVKVNKKTDLKYSL